MSESRAELRLRLSQRLSILEHELAYENPNVICEGLISRDELNAILVDSEALEQHKEWLNGERGLSARINEKLIEANEEIARLRAALVAEKEHHELRKQASQQTGGSLARAAYHSECISRLDKVLEGKE
jgi:hypothetical protein